VLHKYLFVLQTFTIPVYLILVTAIFAIFSSENACITGLGLGKGVKNMFPLPVGLGKG
jgi:hypothetical protein